jgi:hypothetical protein
LFFLYFDTSYIRTQLNVIIDNVHPIGQTKYKNVRFGQRGNTKYTHANLSRHKNIRLVAAGAIGRPIPFSVPPSTSFIPQMKYVLDTITIFCIENVTTSDEEEMIYDSSREKIADNDPRLAPKATVITML